MRTNCRHQACASLPEDPSHPKSRHVALPCRTGLCYPQLYSVAKAIAARSAASTNVVTGMTFGPLCYAASSAMMIGDTCAVAASRFAKISGRLMLAMPPQPAAQLATRARQA